MLCITPRIAQAAPAADPPTQSQAGPEIVTPLGHADRVSQVAVTSDGRHVVTASWDASLILWDAPSGQMIRRLVGHTGHVNAVAVSANDSLVVSGGDDHRVILWDPATGRALLEWGVTSRVDCVAFHPDSGRMLAVDDQGHVLLLKADAVAPIFSTRIAVDLEPTCGFSDKGSVLWVGAQNGEIRRWRTDAMSEMAPVRPATPPKFDELKLLSPDGERMLEVDGDSLTVTDVAIGRVVWSREIKDLYARSGGFSPDGKRLLVGRYRGTMLIDAGSGARLHDMETENEVHGVAVSADGSTLVTGDWAGLAEVWNRDGTPLTPLTVPVQHVRLRAVSPDDVVVFERNNSLIALDLRTGATEEAPRGLTALAEAGLALRPHLPAHQIIAAATSAEAAAVPTTYIDSRSVFECAMAASGRFEICEVDGRFRRLVAGSRAEEPLNLPGGRNITALALSHDEQTLAIGVGTGVLILCHMSDLNCAAPVHLFFDRGGHHTPPAVSTLTFAPGDRFLLATSQESNSGRLVDLRASPHGAPVEVQGWGMSGPGSTGFAFSRDGILFARADHGGVRVWRLDSSPGGRLVETPVLLDGGVERWSPLGISPDGSELSSVSTDGSLLVWSLKGGEAAARQPERYRAHSGGATGLAYDPSGTFLWTSGEDGVLTVWRKAGMKRIGTFSLLADGTVAFVAPDGRFDTNAVDLRTPIRFIMPDQPYRLLPPELFMRDYFEPHLLPRLLECSRRELNFPPACARALAPIRPIMSLNRVQPRVEVRRVRKGRSPAEALVEVAVWPGDDPSQTNGHRHTDVFDLHLFRDGHLVGQWPGAQAVGANMDEPPEAELARWRAATRAPATRDGDPAVHTFAVRLAAGASGQSVQFDAYAFNDDRVKSATSGLAYARPAAWSVRPRAYVLAIGVDGYEAPGRNLNYAVSDATDMITALGRIDGYEVVPVRLASGHDPASWQATKANIRAVLASLAGRPLEPGQPAGVEGVNRLAAAGPDDLVILTFAGHGFTGRNGAFYMLASDSGPTTRVAPEVLPRLIAGAELASWLRPVDAGQAALIIDSCHSAASVSEPDFKPGPLGDRGLGQMAYDKSMRILASSEADEDSFESARLGHGLLTWAMVHDGLAAGPGGYRAADLDHDGRLTLSEWFRYGAIRTPEVHAGLLATQGVTKPGQSRSRTRQTPMLFDFTRPGDRHVSIP